MTWKKNFNMSSKDLDWSMTAIYKDMVGLFLILGTGTTHKGTSLNRSGLPYNLI